MSKGRFWSAVSLACLLGLLGIWLGGVAPLPSPFGINRTREVYALLGVLISILIFAPLSSWIVRTSSRLTRQAINRIASEMAEQVAHLTARRLPPHLPVFADDLQAPGGRLAGVEPVILDTSSVIDGRILEVAKAGFLDGLILLPDFVLRELQQVADSSDTLKRTRGRRGFEVISHLRKIPGVRLQVWEEKSLPADWRGTNWGQGKEVDDKLVALAKVLSGKVLTCDFNLNRVAKIQEVKVMNLNELANALKTLPVPGEKLKVKLLHSGKDKDQGVGYTLDGAMVVVKDGSPFLGQEVEMEVTKIIQGPAGRMIFGKKV